MASRLRVSRSGLFIGQGSEEELCLSVCPSVCLCLSVCPSVCLSVWYTCAHKGHLQALAGTRAWQRSLCITFARTRSRCVEARKGMAREGGGK